MFMERAMFQMIRMFAPAEWWADYWWLCDKCGAAIAPYEEHKHD